MMNVIFLYCGNIVATLLLNFGFDDYSSQLVCRSFSSIVLKYKFNDFLINALFFLKKQSNIEAIFPQYLK